MAIYHSSRKTKTNQTGQKNAHKMEILEAMMIGAVAYHFMPRYCPRCYGLHTPMFFGYPGGYHRDEY